MKARVALNEEPGGRLIIRGEGSPSAFLILDLLPGSFSADAAQLAVGEVEHWGDHKAGLENGADVEAIDHRKLAIDLSQLPSDHFGPRPSGRGRATSNFTRRSIANGTAS